MYIRKDDQVEVITGDDKGESTDRKIAKVLRVIPSRNKIVVEGVNRVYKHLRPSQKNPQGGRLSKEMPIDVSNVKLLLLQVQPWGSHRPPIHRRRPEAALLQVVQGQPGKRRPTQGRPTPPRRKPGPRGNRPEPTELNRNGKRKGAR